MVAHNPPLVACCLCQTGTEPRLILKFSSNQEIGCRWWKQIDWRQQNAESSLLQQLGKSKQTFDLTSPEITNHANFQCKRNTVKKGHQ